MRQRARCLDVLAVGRHQSRGDGPRTGDRDLLTDDSTHGDLEAVDVSGYPHPGTSQHERSEHLVGGEVTVDHHWVGIQVEKSAATLHGGGQIPEVGQVEPALDPVGLRGEADPAEPVRQPQSARVRARIGLLDARQHTGRQVVEQRGGVERLTHGQRHGDRPGAVGKGTSVPPRRP